MHLKDLFKQEDYLKIKENIRTVKQSLNELRNQYDNQLATTELLKDEVAGLHETAKHLAEVRNEFYLDTLETKKEADYKAMEESYATAVNNYYAKNRILKSAPEEKQAKQKEIKEIEELIIQGNLLVSGLETLQDEFHNIKVKDNYDSCPALTVGYDYKNNLPMVLSLIAKDENASSFGTRNPDRLIFSYLDGILSFEDNKHIKLTNEIKAQIYFLIAHLQIDNHTIDLDYEFFKNRKEVELKLPNDRSNDRPDTILLHELDIKMIEKSLHIQWKDAVEYAPFRIKLLVEFILNLK